MLIQTLLNVATALSISPTIPTTIVFNEPITFAAIGKAGDFSVNTNRKKNVIVIQPIRTMNQTELIILTENKNYQFKVHIDSSRYDSFYTVSDGQKNNSYVLVKKTNTWEIYEGVSSIQFKNLIENEIVVNDIIVKARSSVYLPKGTSVYINSERVL
ncbi:MAG: hypothetical protein H7281_15110 [Bacteriovorax sp.]|nr:hypothetical protein [Bacteriovorax sp.]